MTETDIGWAAGILDGEGSICIRRNLHNKNSVSPHHYISVEVSLTHLGALEQLQAWFGGSINKRKTMKLHHRQAWHWGLVSQQAYRFIKIVEPYLRIKQRRALVAIELQSSIDIYQETRKGGEKISDGELRFRELTRQRLLEN